MSGLKYKLCVYQGLRRPHVGNEPIKEKLNTLLLHAVHDITYAERFLRDNKFVNVELISNCHFQQ